MYGSGVVGQDGCQPQTSELVGALVQVNLAVFGTQGHQRLTSRNASQACCVKLLGEPVDPTFLPLAKEGARHHMRPARQEAEGKNVEVIVEGDIHHGSSCHVQRQLYLGQGRFALEKKRKRDDSY